MKSIKLKQLLLLLVTVLTFSMCEQNGEIQFVVIDDVETNANVKGLNGVSEFTANGDTDVSVLLENAAEFVEADVESVIVTLKDYDGGKISGEFKLSIGGNPNPLFNETLELVNDQSTSPITIPKQFSGILTAINKGNVKYTLSAKADSPISDSDFSLNLKFKIKAKVQ